MEIKLKIPYGECTKEEARRKIEDFLDKLSLIYNLNISYSTDCIKALIAGEEPAKGVCEFKESKLEAYLNLPWLHKGTEIKKIEEAIEKKLKKVLK